MVGPVSFRIITAGIVLLTMGGQAAPALAQSDEGFTFVNNAARDASLFEFSFASPGSPALPLLGVGNDDITRVSDPQKFAVSFVSDVLGEGKGGAFALDMSPFWLVPRRTFSISGYNQRSWFQQALVRSSLSVAVSGGKAGTTEATPSSLVFGFSTKLSRSNDPLRLSDKDSDGQPTTLFGKCLEGDFRALTIAGNQALYSRRNELGATIRSLDLQASQLRREADALAAGPNAGAPETVAKVGELRKQADGVEQQSKELQAARLALIEPEGTKKFLALERKKAGAALMAAYDACADQTRIALQRAASWDVGAGVRLAGTPGKLEELKGSGFILWTTYSSGVLFGGLDDSAKGDSRLRARFVGHARAVIDEGVYDPLGVRTSRATSVNLVGGLEGVPAKDGENNFQWSIQGGWTKQDSSDKLVEDRNFWRGLGKASLKVSSGIWLTGTLGRVEGKGVADDTYALLGFTFSPPGREKSLSEVFPD